VGKKAGDVWDGNGLKMKLVWCPPGSFRMGNAESDLGSVDGAPHEVTLTKGFWLGQTEVTQSQWQQVMGTTPWTGKSNFLGSVREGPDYPAVSVSWDDAHDFCRKLMEQESRAGRLPIGAEYRLPTEAQWEYACRAGTTTRYSFGDDVRAMGDYAWYEGNTLVSNESYAHRVGLKRPNAWGLHDMHGNVEEWCADWYDAKFYESGGVTDPVNLVEPLKLLTDDEIHRVVRGGYWIGSGVGSAYRLHRSP
jgi:formylglycine-generating enzyme required for sulfatase activity